MNVTAPVSALQVGGAEVRVFRNLEDLSHAAAEFFVSGACEAVGANQPFSVALSGGSTPKELYSLLATPEFSQQIPWKGVHLFWGDERCVPPDNPESNFGMVQQALLRHINIPASNVHRIRGEDPPEQAAAAYEAELRQFFGISEGVPRFDLMLLGLGEDGHTASLFPGSAVLSEKSRLAAATYVEKMRAHRITLTVPVLDHARQIVFLVSGERKRSAVSRVLAPPDDNHPLPAQYVRPVDGKLLWLTDKAAAASLTTS